jgi:hypothetical protein
MNDEVGEAFFSFLHSVDLTGYHDQDFPITKAKEDAIVKRLDSVASYIKDKYILRYKNFDTNLKDAHNEYSDYCSMNNIKATCKIEFNKRLEIYKITSFKSGNFHNKFNFKHSKLEEIAVANKWKHSTDQYENGDQFVDDNHLDVGIDKDAEIKELKEQYEMLKNQLKFNCLDVNVEETYEEPKIITFNLDPYSMILKDIKDQQEWITDYMKQIKPKKKKPLNKDQIKKDIFEIDFMCD